MGWIGPADLAVQQVAWWTAVLCAAHGRPGAAAAAGFGAVAVHLLVRRTERARIAVAALAAAAYGVATDSLLAATGLATFAGGAGGSPAWMAGLWAIFGAGLTASLRTPARWPAPALAAAAALAGPLAYQGGAALQAIVLAGPAARLAVALQWGAGIPALAWVARRPWLGDLGARAGAHP